ncbi:LysR substrate-binding domain-containing protein, partial [Candidatus Burkholderia verschuerenii]|uniref:LysR substrate-binding domain-containing protein n=1 Tax=Candidatus Burkholderia verschuerenii TaxID=242163 RepID=UPI000B13FD0D
MVREASLLHGDADRDGLSDRLKIGAISTALTGMLPAALRELTQRAPRARLVIVPGTSQSLFQSLQAGDLDAAIVVSPPFALPKTMRAVLLRAEPLLLLADRDRGRPRGPTPPTPPCVRVRTRRFGSVDRRWTDRRQAQRT